MKNNDKDELEVMELGFYSADFLKPKGGNIYELNFSTECYTEVRFKKVEIIFKKYDLAKAKQEKNLVTCKISKTDLEKEWNETECNLDLEITVNDTETEKNFDTILEEHLAEGYSGIIRITFTGTFTDPFPSALQNNQSEMVMNALKSIIEERQLTNEHKEEMIKMLTKYNQDVEKNIFNPEEESKDPKEE